MNDRFEMGPASEDALGTGEALFGACFAMDGDPPGDQKNEPPPAYDKDELERRERMTREYVEMMIKRQSEPKPQPKPEAPKPEAPKPEAPKPDPQPPNPFLKPEAPKTPAQRQFPPIEPLPPKKELPPGQPEPVVAKPPGAASDPNPFKKPDAPAAEKEDFWKSIEPYANDDRARTIAIVLAALGIAGGLKLYRQLGSDAVLAHLNDEKATPTKVAAGSGDVSVKAFDRTSGAALTTKSADGKFFEIARPDGTKESISVSNAQRVRYEFVGEDARQIKQLKAMTELQIKDLNSRAGWSVQTDVVRDANMQQKQRFVLTEAGTEVGTIVSINADHTVQVKQADGTLSSKVVGADTRFVLKVRDDVTAARKASGADISALMDMASPRADAKQWKKLQTGTTPTVTAPAPLPGGDVNPAQTKLDALEKANADMQRQLDEVLKELGEMKTERTKVAPTTQTDTRDGLLRPGPIDEPVQFEKAGKSKGTTESVEFTEAERERLAKDYESRAKSAEADGVAEKASWYRELAAGLRSTDVAKRSGTERFIAEICGGKGKALAIGGGALVLVSLGLGGLAMLREQQSSRKQFAEAKTSGSK